MTEKDNRHPSLLAVIASGALGTSLKCQTRVSTTALAAGPAPLCEMRREPEPCTQQLVDSQSARRCELRQLLIAQAVRQESENARPRLAVNFATTDA